MALNQPQGFQPGLGQSNANNFYSSGIAASQLNGTGSQVQANKLNRSKNAAGVTVVPGPVQYVEQPVEVIKKVKKQVFAPTAAPVVQVNQLDPTLRNLIAETQAKVALLVMENNRIKWRIAQRDAEISRLRSQGPSQVIVNRPSTTVVSSLGPGFPTSTAVARPPVATTSYQPTQQTSGQVIQRHGETTTTTTTTGAPSQQLAYQPQTGGFQQSAQSTPAGVSQQPQAQAGRAQ